MSTSLQIGETIDNGKYVIESELGEGGLAVVYKVKHATLGTPFAIKILKVTLPSLQERLIVEGQLQASLQHPNVVKVTDVIKVDGFPALVMEFIDGIALDDYLNDSTPSLRDAEDMFLQVLDAVEEAHERGIIHRDLKPANVMMQRTRTKWVPKVCDFGLGKDLEKEGQTRTGQQMGTPAYMAPEQIRSTKDVDQRADIFSLGAILYELLTGHRAFQASNTLDLLNAVASQPHPTPRLYIQDLEERYVQAIDGALTKNAEFRIPNCETLRKVLLGELEWAVERASSPTGGDTLMSLGLDLMPEDNNQGTNPLPPQNSLISERRVHQISPNAGGHSLPPFEPQPESTSSKVPIFLALLIVLIVLGGGAWYLTQTPTETSPDPQLSSTTEKPEQQVEEDITKPKEEEKKEEVATKETSKPETQNSEQKISTTITTSAKPQVKTKAKPKPKPKPKAKKQKSASNRPKASNPINVLKEEVKEEIKEEVKDAVKQRVTGTVKFKQVTGLSRAFLADSSGKTYSRSNYNSGPVPVGNYTIKLVCEKDGKKKTKVAGSHEVKANQTRTLNCNCVFNTCKRQ